MDVTSLLNASAAAHKEAQTEGEAIGQVDRSSTPLTTAGTPDRSPGSHTPPSRRSSDARTPNRNRTPWDANGYALPLTVNSKPSQTPARPIFRSESPVGSVSPKSPRHKLSDSHSSLSSYASSTSSLSHSRISSMSTVGGFQTMSSIPDVPSVESELEPAELVTSKNPVADTWQRGKSDAAVSPTAVTEEATLAGRPGSPSDALLMSRSQDLDRKSPSGTAVAKHLNADLIYLVPPELAKHKRAISAPDFAAISRIDRTYPPLPTTIQPTPPPLYQGGRTSSYTMDKTPDSPAIAVPSILDEPLKCLYVTHCDTGSQLRKAISHIFGRNKLCTRMIPQHVWVHFCRKHYQRSRYRNAQEYAKLQCDLVEKQVSRVQAWSDENKKCGQAGIVLDWSLSMRKREQNRVQENSNRRHHQDISDNEDTYDRAVLNGTAVPDWLRDKCGEGYSTAEILDIVKRLKGEMEQNSLTQIPDIEILPNISTDHSDGGKIDGKSKPALKRKTSAGSTHKRSQSVGNVLHSHTMTPISRHGSQSTYWKAKAEAEDQAHSSPVEKRPRLSETPSYSDHRPTEPPNFTRLPERPAPTVAPALRPIHHLPHRPAFNYIQEHRGEESSYMGEEGTRSSQYNFGGVLPAPSPQRYSNQPMATQIEANTTHDYLDARRPPHHRSHSEMAGFGNYGFNPKFTFRPTSTTEYPGHQGYPVDPIPSSRGYMPQEHGYPPSGPPSGPPSYYDESPMPPTRGYAHQPHWTSPAPSHNTWPSPGSSHASAYPARHARHQSTPNVPHIGVSRITPEEDRMHAASRLPAPYGHTPPQHKRQHSYAPSHHHYSSYGPTIPESEQAKAIYAERR
ncbi:hypothetical protein F4778DRAFT_155206 [Xylariomycetidae sp. FL2044]|nr:hypothetical protein F4778DRAFT_155206 [Xylariomycetidae sp. FL2044]